MENINVAGYIKNTEGKWVLAPETKAASKAMYYSGRVAYDPHDLRHIIGQYTPNGEVIPYKTKHELA